MTDRYVTTNHLPSVFTSAPDQICSTWSIFPTIKNIPSKTTAPEIGYITDIFPPARFYCPLCSAHENQNTANTCANPMSKMTHPKKETGFFFLLMAKKKNHRDKNSKYSLPPCFLPRENPTKVTPTRRTRYFSPTRQLSMQLSLRGMYPACQLEIYNTSLRKKNEKTPTQNHPRRDETP